MLSCRAASVRRENPDMIIGNITQGAIPIVTPIGGTEPTLGSNAIALALHTGAEECPFFLCARGQRSHSVVQCGGLAAEVLGCWACGWGPRGHGHGGDELGGGGEAARGGGARQPQLSWRAARHPARGRRGGRPGRAPRTRARALRAQPAGRWAHIRSLGSSTAAACVVVGQACRALLRCRLPAPSGHHRQRSRHHHRAALRQPRRR
jgi:hypothetical protein